MIAGSFDTSMIWAIFPEIGLVVLALLVLIADLTLGEVRRRWLGWLTAAGLLIIFGVSFAVALPGEPRLIWGGMLRQDLLSFLFQMIFLFGAGVTTLFAVDSDAIGKRGEFYILLLASTLGMNLMASASDLIMLFLAIEMTSIPLYALAGFLTKDYKSTESGFKYFLFGSTTSAVMLYGLSLLYGFTGTTQVYELAAQLQAGQLTPFVLVAVTLLILVGFGFKVSAAPFHFWAPDVYEGAPTPVAGFLSTASKAAGFAVLMRFLLAVFPTTAPYWAIIIGTLSTLSMIIGNTLALTQKNIKRLLAYSSIAQAGYMLIGVACVTPLGFSATAFYLIAYLVTNLAAFGIVTIVGRLTGSDELSAYAGLSRRSPGLALALLVAFLSLAGVPPFGGFVGKVFVFGAAIQANLVWLAAVGIINSVIGLYYYLTVLKVAYLYRSEDESRAVSLPRAWSVALIFCIIGILVLGAFFGPWYNWSLAAAQALY